MTTEDTWPPEAAETIREGLSRPVQGYAARSDRRKEQQPAEPDAGDVEALADAIRLGLRRCRVEDAPSPLIRESDLTHATYMVEQAVSDWLAAHDEQVRREHGERIAQAVSSAFTGDMFEENAMGAAAENEWTWFRWLALEAIARQEQGS